MKWSAAEPGADPFVGMAPKIYPHNSRLQKQKPILLNKMGFYQIL